MAIYMANWIMNGKLALLMANFFLWQIVYYLANIAIYGIFRILADFGLIYGKFLFFGKFCYMALFFNLWQNRIAFLIFLSNS